MQMLKEHVKLLRCIKYCVLRQQPYNHNHNNPDTIQGHFTQNSYRKTKIYMLAFEAKKWLNLLLHFSVQMNR